MKVIKKLFLKKKWIIELKKLESSYSPYMFNETYHNWRIEIYRRALDRLDGNYQDGWFEEYLIEIRGDEKSFVDKGDIEYREYILEFIKSHSKSIGFYKLGSDNPTVSELIHKRSHKGRVDNINLIKDKINNNYTLKEYMDYCSVFLEYCDFTPKKYEDWKKEVTHGS